MKNDKNKAGYVKPSLVVYGDFSKITKLTGAGFLVDQAFPRKDPLTFQS